MGGDPTAPGIGGDLERRARLAALLAERAGRSEDPIEGPASAGQRALWFLQQADPRGVAYHMPTVVRFHSLIEVAQLAELLKAVARRHPTLRTTYALRDGLLVQRVHAELPLSIEVTDLGGCDDTALQVAFREEIARPFDLKSGPVFRTRVFRRGPQEQYAVQTLHHIAVDALSQRVLLDDLRTLMQGEIASPPLSAGYLDFSRRERRMLEGERGDLLRRYWRETLAGAPRILDLAPDRPRASERSDWGRNYPFEVSAALLSGLRTLAQEADVTLFVVLLSAFEVLLSRRSGMEDLLVGTYVSGRDASGLEGEVGDFVNTLPIRADLSGNPTFRALIRRTNERVVGALEHRDYPFSLLVADLLRAREAGRPPLVQVVLVLQSLEEGWESSVLGTGGQTLVVGPWSFESVALNERPTESELRLELAATRRGLVGALVYDAALFDASVAAGLVSQYVQLLDEIVRDPDRRVRSLPLAPAAAQQRLLASWNPRSRPLVEPPPACVHELFEAQAERRPDQVALRWRDESWTYAALDAAANHVGCQLQALGCGPDHVVGLFLDRAPTMVAALLGILKAGAAYLPLDPDYPAARLAGMLEDSGAPVVVTSSRLAPRLAAKGLRVVLLDTMPVAPMALARPNRGVRPEHLAYVIFTSASTGRPKGVAIEHRQAVSFLQAAQSIHSDEELAGVLATTSISFDISVNELLLALCSGGTLILIDSLLAMEDLPPDPPVRKVSGTPSVLSEVLRHGRLPHTVLTYGLGGEAASAHLVRALHEQPGVQRVINSYGPTETTVYNTAVDLPAGLAVTPPLGAPFPNSTLLVLDEALQPVPPGVIGEIFVGGHGVARGYLGRPELTAAAFLPDPFFGQARARMYRTGDLARAREDGDVEFLGRVDHQVKLRGVRIELVEVESALTALPQVAEAVASVCEMSPGDKHLVAYVVPRRSPADAEEIRALLRQRLPRHSVPTLIVALETLPRLPNGKVDRRGLPAVRREALGGAVADASPTSALERAVADTFAAVLGVAEVGRSDDFFALGGHSLQTLEVVARLSEVAGRPVAVRQLLHAPVVRDLAAAIGTDADHTGEASCAVPAPAARPHDPRFTMVRESVDRLIEAGRLPGFPAAAIGYLPDSMRELAPRIRALAGTGSVASGCLITHLGRIGLVLLPQTLSELCADAQRARHIGDAAALAGQLGARVVALTGVIPSLTDYGREIVAVSSDLQLPALTTGHGTTTAAIVQNTLGLCRLAGVELPNVDVAFLGLGAIGQATLRLALRVLPQPRRVLLCDVYRNAAVLEQLSREARQAGWTCPIGVHVSPSPAAVPDDLYQARVVIGATNVASVLDVERLSPGTLVVDDSSPHCFDVAAAFARVRSRGDLLFTEGGALRLDVDPMMTLYLPEGFEAHGSSFAERNEGVVMGCTLSALLSARYAELPPTLGPVAQATSEQHLRFLTDAGVTAPGPHCDGSRLSAVDVERFRASFA